jgi:hypothetical protein
MKRGYACRRVIDYLAETTGEIILHCISQVRVKCGIGYRQMETVVFDLKQSGVIVETKRGKHRIINLSKNARNV